MSEPVIRRMQADDRERVERFYENFGPDGRMFFNRNGGNQRVTMRFFDGEEKDARIHWVGVDGDEVVGYVFLKEVDRGVPWLGIAVSEKMRGKHFGEKLIGTAVDWCRENGKGGILLITHTANIRAQTLYERCGFEKMGIHGASGEFLYIKRL